MQEEIGEPAYQKFLNDQQRQRLGMADGGQPQQQQEPQQPPATPWSGVQQTTFQRKQQPTPF